MKRFLTFMGIVPLLSAFLLFFGRDVALSQTVKEFHDQAKELVQSYRFLEAIELLQIGMQQHPENPDLARQLGTLLVQTGNASQGERLLRAALARRPHQLELVDALAGAELGQGRPGSAVALLRDVLWHRPSDAQAHYRLAHALFLNGEFRRALEPARRAVELAQADAMMRRFYSLLLDIQGNRSEALQHLKAAQQLSPENAYLAFQVAEKEQQAGRLEDGLVSLRRASQLDLENPLYHSALSQLYEKLGLKELATQEAEKARQFTDVFEAYITALDLAAKDRNGDAAGLLEPLVQRHPEFVTGALLLANLYSKLGREQLALDLYLKVVQSYPDHIAARQEATWILAEKGDYQGALRIMGKLPQEGSTRLLLQAYWHEQAGNYAGALEAFKSAHSANPLNPALVLWIAHCLRARGQRQEAIEVLAKAGKLRPGGSAVQQQAREISIEQQRETAFQLFEAKQWKSALQGLQAVTEADGNVADATTLFQMAYCHQQMGELKEALSDYYAGLKLDSQASWARQNLAGILYQFGRYREAASEWEQIPRGSRAPEVWQQLGFCYAHLGRYEAAESSFQAALNSGLDSPPLLYHLGVARLRRVQGVDAWNLIRRSAAARYGPAQDLLRRAGLWR
jgi:tetratricopeptide (TPR) repeat protein